MCQNRFVFSSQRRMCQNRFEFSPLKTNRFRLMCLSGKTIYMFLVHKDVCDNIDLFLVHRDVCVKIDLSLAKKKVEVKIDFNLCVFWKNNLYVFSSQRRM